MPSSELIPYSWPNGRWRPWNEQWEFVSEHDERPPDSELRKAYAVTIDYTDGRPRWSGKVVLELVDYREIDAVIKYHMRMWPVCDE